MCVTLQSCSRAGNVTWANLHPLQSADDKVHIHNNPDIAHDLTARYTAYRKGSQRCPRSFCLCIKPTQHTDEKSETMASQTIRQGVAPLLSQLACLGVLSGGLLAFNALWNAEIMEMEDLLAPVLNRWPLFTLSVTNTF